MNKNLIVYVNPSIILTLICIVTYQPIEANHQTSIKIPIEFYYKPSDGQCTLNYLRRTKLFDYLQNVNISRFFDLQLVPLSNSGDDVISSNKEPLLTRGHHCVIRLLRHDSTRLLNTVYALLRASPLVYGTPGLCHELSTIRLQFAEIDSITNCQRQQIINCTLMSNQDSSPVVGQHYNRTRIRNRIDHFQSQTGDSSPPFLVVNNYLQAGINTDHNLNEPNLRLLLEYNLERIGLKVDLLQRRHGKIHAVIQSNQPSATLNQYLNQHYSSILRTDHQQMSVLIRIYYDCNSYASLQFLRDSILLPISHGNLFDYIDLDLIPSHCHRHQKQVHSCAIQMLKLYANSQSILTVLINLMSANQKQNLTESVIRTVAQQSDVPVEVYEEIAMCIKSPDSKMTLTNERVDFRRQLPFAIVDPNDFDVKHLENIENDTKLLRHQHLKKVFSNSFKQINRKLIALSKGCIIAVKSSLDRIDPNRCQAHIQYYKRVMNQRFRNKCSPNLDQLTNVTVFYDPNHWQLLEQLLPIQSIFNSKNQIQIAFEPIITENSQISNKEITTLINTVQIVAHRCIIKSTPAQILVHFLWKLAKNTQHGSLLNIEKYGKALNLNSSIMREIRSCMLNHKLTTDNNSVRTPMVMIQRANHDVDGCYFNSTVDTESLLMTLGFRRDPNCGEIIRFKQSICVDSYKSDQSSIEQLFNSLWQFQMITDDPNKFKQQQLTIVFDIFHRQSKYFFEKLLLLDNHRFNSVDLIPIGISRKLIQSMNHNCTSSEGCHLLALLECACDSLNTNNTINDLKRSIRVISDLLNVTAARHPHDSQSSVERVQNQLKSALHLVPKECLSSREMTKNRIIQQFRQERLLERIDETSILSAPLILYRIKAGNHWTMIDSRGLQREQVNRVMMIHGDASNNGNNCSII